MQTKPFVFVGSRLATPRCPEAVADAAAALAAALLGDAATSIAPARELLLTDLHPASEFDPERAGELVPATLKWGGSTGRKDLA